MKLLRGITTHTNFLGNFDHIFRKNQSNDIKCSDINSIFDTFLSDFSTQTHFQRYFDNNTTLTNFSTKLDFERIFNKNQIFERYFEDFRQTLEIERIFDAK